MTRTTILEGTGEELQRHLKQFPHDRFRLTLLPTSLSENPTETPLRDGSLFDLLGDYIGSVEGSGENNAERHSQVFEDYLAKKQSAGHL